ncbi:MAG: class I SAM-dependent methyltransferase [Candidatus Binatia bacterium]
MSDVSRSEYQESVSKLWGAGGHGYDDISFMVSDALAHAAQRLQAAEGESVLDVATGTGWTARNLARSGARVSAIDLSEELLAGAKELSKHIAPAIDFRYADAQELPFEDGSFDAVASTFGVIFAPEQARAARELARVCRRGGRLCLLTWPEGFLNEFWAITAKYSSTPPQGPAPTLWGDPQHVESLLGEFFDLSFEEGINRSYHPDGEQIARLYEQGFGPVTELRASLDEEHRNELHADLVAFHETEALRTDAGLRMERPYLLVLGTRR